MDSGGQTGTILRAQGGFYFVETDRGVCQCTLPGKHKRGNQNVLPGDQVEISRLEESCVIRKVLPRKNFLTRPGIANIDQLIIMASVMDPPPDYLLMDRLLCIARYNDIHPLLVFTKWDLPTEKTALQEEVASYYRQTGDRLYHLGEGILDDDMATVLSLLDHRVTALAGNSGVGKSSFINRMTGRGDLVVESVSSRLGRGRHTTRTVTLFPVAHGFIADTPGFNVLELPGVLMETDLARLYPDYLPLITQCRFSNCLHDREPACAVRAEVEAGNLSKARYENYLRLLREIQNKE